MSNTRNARLICNEVKYEKFILYMVTRNAQWGAEIIHENGLVSNECTTGYLGGPYFDTITSSGIKHLRWNENDK